MKIKIASLAFYLLCFSFSIFSQEIIQLLFNERPPYMMSDGEGNVIGLTADVANYAFKMANINFVWVEMPSQRQLTMLSENKNEIAALGWFKNPDREKFAKYSIPIYQDRQISLLARKGNKQLSSYDSLDSFFADKSINLLIKDGYSYGSFIDEKLHKSQLIQQKTVGESIAMIRMIDAGRADCMFISPEEASVAIKTSGVKESSLELITFNDMPVGENRYIIYSQNVNDSTISQINNYIEEYISTLTESN